MFYNSGIHKYLAENHSMGKILDSITPKQQAFIKKQHMFFVATSPTEITGRINLSPKGLDCFRVLDEHSVAYLDVTGSGNETAAHVNQNGRITFMFCSFEGAPNILRLYGTGESILPGARGFDELAAQFPPLPGIRQFIRAKITATQDSCGFGVPLMEFAGERDELTNWADKMGDEKLQKYRDEKNRKSIDGIEVKVQI